jgi:ketosteroid isomerase-like protein
VYKLIAARRVRRTFEALSGRDSEAVVKELPPRVHHLFPGDNALGGERHSRDAFRRWLERVWTLFPDISFEVSEIAVKGWPWDLRVAVQWTDRGRAADGEPYDNRGAHWIRIHRGKPVRIQAYLDTDKVTAALERMSRAGIEEATAPQIRD